MNNFALQMSIKKVDQFKKEVFGFASIIEKADGTPVVDHQGDIIEEAELEKAVYEYMLNSREAGDMHETTEGIGKIIESFVITKAKRELLKIDLPLGWWVGYKIEDDDVFKRIVDGELTMFSIGGTAMREEID